MNAKDLALITALGGGGGSSPSGGSLVVPHFTVRFDAEEDEYECTCDKTYSELRSAYEQDAVFFGGLTILDPQDPTVVVGEAIVYLTVAYESGLMFQMMPDIVYEQITVISIEMDALNTLFYQGVIPLRNE